jgi:tetratricopeptide (TPR) repeat protein
MSAISGIRPNSDELMVEADILLQEGRQEEAVVLLEQLLLERVGFDDSVYGDTLQKLIDCYISLQIRFDLVNRYFQQLLSVRKTTLGNNHMITMNIKRDYGIFHVQQGNYNIALTFLKKFENWYLQQNGENGLQNTELIVPKYYIGKCYLHNRFLLEARNCFEFCFQKRKSEINDPKDIHMLTYGAELGNVLALLDMHLSALPLLEELYSITKDIPELDSQHLLIMNYLAIAYFRAGQEVKGNDFFDRCIRLKKQKFGCYHVEIIKMHEQLIEVSKALNRPHETFQKLQLLYKLCLDHLGVDHNKTVQILKESQNFVEGLSNDQHHTMLKSIYGLQRDSIGRCSRYTLETMRKLILLQLKMEDSEKLLEFTEYWFLACLEMAGKISTNDQPNQEQIFHDIRATMEYVISFLIQKDYTLFKNACLAAAECYWTSVQHLIASTSSLDANEKHALLEENEKWVIQMYYRCREFIKLEKFLEVKYQSARDTFGEVSLTALTALVIRAHHHRHCEKFSTAIEGYLHCFEIQKQCPSCADDKYGSELYFEISAFLQVCYLKTHTVTNSIEWFRSFHQSCKEALGARHVVTVNALVNYVLVDNSLSNSFMDDVVKLVDIVDKKKSPRDRLRPLIEIARVLIQRQQNLKAKYILEDLHRNLQEAFGNDLVTFEVLSLLVECYNNLGDQSKRKVCLQTSYDMVKLVKGEHHKETEDLKRALQQDECTISFYIIMGLFFFLLFMVLAIKYFGSRHSIRKEEL